MRKIMLLAAIFAALGMASQPAEPRERTFSFRHFSPHARANLHLGHHGFTFHRGSFFGKPRHFGHRGIVFKFGGHDNFVFKFGQIPHFKPYPFGHGPHGPFFKLGQRPHLELFQRRGFAFGKPWHVRPGHFMGFDDGLWGSDPSPHGAIPGPESFDAVLKQLEEQGFRHVPRLLREGGPASP